MNKTLLLSSLLLPVLALATLNKDGLRGVNETQSAQTLGHSRMGVTLLNDISIDATVFRNMEITESGKATATSPAPVKDISDVFIMSLYPSLSLGLGEYFDVSAALPLYYDAVSVGIPGTEKFNYGDLRGHVKLRLPIPQEGNVLDLSLLAGGQLPITNLDRAGLVPRRIDYITSNETAEVTAFGNRELMIKGGLLATMDFHRLHVPFPLQLHLNGTYRIYQGSYPQVFTIAAAAEYNPVEFLSLYGELINEVPDRFPKYNGLAQELTQIRIQTGGVVHTGIGLDIHVGLNMSISNDRYVRGATVRDGTDALTYDIHPYPDMWATFGITWNGFLVSQDSDGDGIPNKRDKCPNEPEDMDGFEDEDGCPDPDNDGDGICDPWVAENGLLGKYAGVCKGSDKCPNEPEDKDGFEDEDGCPDPDNDGDGICDPWVAKQGLLAKYAGVCKGSDKCPFDAEDKDGFEDEDGCPDFDNDKDGIPDEEDKCPNEPEDMDGFEDEDGCPDPDNDGDGICDPWVAEQGLLAKYAGICKGSDKCPNEPETFNGFEDEDGCPDTAVKSEPVEKNVTLRGVNFKTGTAELTFESRAVLDGVVQQLKDYPEVEIEIRGYTDHIGTETNNQILSEQRARSVMSYFVQQGIDPSRMRAVGLGESNPVASNKTAAGRAQNRRIELYRTK